MSLIHVHIFIFLITLSLLSGCGENILGNESFIGGKPNTAKNLLVLTNGAYQYSDATFAINCLEYLKSTAYSNHGSANYWLDPDGTGPNGAFQAHCDMSTDGGGWTLIGRGREDWAWNNAGLNKSEVYKDIGTVNAFTPAYYSATTIDNISGQINISSLTDGLRIKRSADTTGTTFQEIRWHFSALVGFSWTFDSSYALRDVTLNGLNLGGSNSRDSVGAHGNDENRLFTWGWGSHASKMGFSYGNTVNAGTNSATNFLWENSTEGHSLPYTEVYIRE